MSFLAPTPVLANAPLFGNQWLALFAILGGVAGFMALIIVVGRWLAATHPDAPSRSSSASAPSAPATTAAAAQTISPEILAVIASAVAVTVGPRARVAAVVPVKSQAPSVEMLMQQWSIEGRRQIYSSHQIR
ncbi:hypothetical protein [Opitutus sp. ER46]|uniref:hypothetical protein n=1 Tax=Opitutus sp. ER46 TaxID=2161864 RepID=UPI000D31A30D|nr:hypothetical protein [Opitutus sp. ER46]PTX99054.1 hypothetical protein DB354_03295 [Opitutus sp. ER46]